MEYIWSGPVTICAPVHPKHVFSFSPFFCCVCLCVYEDMFANTPNITSRFPRTHKYRMHSACTTDRSQMSRLLFLSSVTHTHKRPRREFPGCIIYKSRPSKVTCEFVRKMRMCLCAVSPKTSVVNIEDDYIALDTRAGAHTHTQTYISSVPVCVCVCNDVLSRMKWERTMLGCDLRMHCWYRIHCLGGICMWRRFYACLPGQFTTLAVHFCEI